MSLTRENSRNDKDFLEKAIRGDRVGLEYLVRTYKDLAYTIAIRIVLNKEDAEEVVQDSFMKAFAALPRFRRAARFSTWLFRIVYNTALSKIKLRKLSIVDHENTDGMEFAYNQDQDWEVLNGEERKKYINLALDKLNEEDRIIITLHYMGERSISEICEITGKGKSAVKMQLLRSRGQIESTLALLLKKEIKYLL